MDNLGTVYILRSLKNDSYYIGSTNDLERRLIQHNSGLSRYTSHLLPLKLIFSQAYPSLQHARKIEVWLKKLRNKNILNQIIHDGVISKTFE